MDIIKYTDLKCINSKVSETILRKMPDNEFYKLKKMFMNNNDIKTLEKSY